MQTTSTAQVHNRPDLQPNRARSAPPPFLYKLLLTRSITIMTDGASRASQLGTGTPAPRATQNGVQVLHGCASGAALHPLEHPATNMTTTAGGRKASARPAEKMTHSVPLPAFLPLIASSPVPGHTLLTLATSFSHTPDLGIGHSTLRSFGCGACFPPALFSRFCS
ncbi:hypothetical protein K438DRAFT_1965933 [Mycena galopus ATCC 62051]|nr:hypothetical protein K438DRAFT_1965933 [Mycena galopus ATCC 62051]